MNSDSFAALQGGASASSRNLLVPLTGLATAETIFTMGSDAGSGVNAFIQIPQQSAIVGSNAPLDPNANSSFTIDQLGAGGDYRLLRGRPYFNSGSFDGRAFRVRVTGRLLTSAAANTVTVKLYQNTTAALGGTALISAASASLGNAVAGNFLVEAGLIWDSASQKLFGEAYGIVAGNYTARTTVSAGGISVTTPANLLFVASITFSTGAANTCTPIEFGAEQV